MAASVLVRYRIMAYVTAVLLIVLVFVGLPLQAAGHPGVAHGVGFAHGMLYIVYLLVAFELTRRMRIPIFHTILVLIAGTVPFGAIFAERRLTALHVSRERQAARAAAAAADEDGPDPAAPAPAAPSPTLPAATASAPTRAAAASPARAAPPAASPVPASDVAAREA